MYANTGSANPRGMTISTFNINTNTWGSDIPVTPTINTTTTTSGYGATHMALGVRPSGNIVILYNGSTEVVTGATYARVYWSEYNGSSWSSGAALSGQSGVAKDFVASQILMSASSGRAHLFVQTIHTAATGFDLYHVSVPSGGGLQSMQLLANDLSNKVFYFQSPVGLGTTYNPGSGDSIAVPYIAGGNSSDGPPDFGPAKVNNIITAYDADNPSWTTTTFDTTTQISGFQPAFEVLLSCSFNYNNLRLYIFWVSPLSYGTPGGTNTVSTSGLIAYSSSSGSGWTTPVIAETLATPNVPSGIIGFFPGSSTLPYLFVYKIDSTVFYT